jgi:hypothetical protein
MTFESYIFSASDDDLVMRPILLEASTFSDASDYDF